jgi:hypothetical protein
MRTIVRPAVRLLLLVAPLALAPAPARAEFTISSQSVTATPGSTGFVEILLTNNFATTQTLSGFSVDLSLVSLGVPDVRFTNVDSLTTPAYVFNTTGSGTLTFDVFPNTGFNANDVSFSAFGFEELAAGATYGLARIHYEVDVTAPAGLRPITFTLGAGTLFSDGGNNPYANADLAFSSGGIDVQAAASAVPAPPGVVLAAAGGLTLFGYSRRRTRRPV